MNELVTNSLKHAFPEGREGEIVIDIRCDPSDRITLRVADDGVGADVEAVRDSETLGLRLVRTLVRQLNGELAISAEGGLAFTIVFGENG